MYANAVIPFTCRRRCRLSDKWYLCIRTEWNDGMKWNWKIAFLHKTRAEGRKRESESKNTTRWFSYYFVLMLRMRLRLLYYFPFYLIRLNLSLSLSFFNEKFGSRWIYDIARKKTHEFQEQEKQLCVLLFHLTTMIIVIQLSHVHNGGHCTFHFHFQFHHNDLQTFIHFGMSLFLSFQYHSFHLPFGCPVSI